MGNVLVPSIAQSNDTPKAPTPAIQNSLAQDAKPSLRQLSFKALVKKAIFRKVNSIQAGCFLRLDVDQMSPKAFGFCQDLSMDLHGSERWGRACNKSNESFLSIRVYPMVHLTSVPEKHRNRMIHSMLVFWCLACSLVVIIAWAALIKGETDS